MSVDKKEVERLKQLQIGKKCTNCKIGHYIKSFTIFCINCTHEPFTK